MKKKWSEMTTAELREATKEFNEPFAFEKGKPLTAADRKKHLNARLFAKRKKKASDSPVSVVIDRLILDEADELAAKLHLTRSDLVNSGLRAVLAMAQG